MINTPEYSCLRCGGQHKVGDCPVAASPPPPASGSALIGGYRFDETLHLLRNKLHALAEEGWRDEKKARGAGGTRRMLTRAVDRQMLVAELAGWVMDRATEVEKQNAKLSGT